MLKKYLHDLAEIARRGDAREESFYPALSSLLAETARAAGRADVHVTTQPRPTDAGNPDFRVWNGADRIIGYIEAKPPSEERLDLVEESEQLRRYRATFPNLILTNFLEFRLYRDGQRVDSVLLARPFVLHGLRTAPPLEKPAELAALFDRFLDFSLPKSFSAESLAVALAVRTRFMRDIVARQLADERDAAGPLTGFFEAFQQFLIGGLTAEDFADLYAQTITYGLFAARVRSDAAFSRRAAFDRIPRTIGVLRDLFRFISLEDLPAELAWIVDDVAGVLAAADAPGLLAAYFRDGKGSDPIVHFYETFLAQYDPAERERRGVYYTPEPVVSYIVRSLHRLLKTEFGVADGLAAEGVTLLDPAAGTMTFVARASQEAVREFEGKYGTGGREQFIRGHILRDFYAFELMMAPYAVGHLKMSFFLEELGHRLADDERVRFYLTNTLDMEELAGSRLPGLSSLAEESRLAGQVKRQTPVLVILGNPPYSGISTNTGEWITGLIEDYKYVDGQHFGEKKHWLQDDYVKFLRFAQWKIDQAGRGVVGMITNHGYLDNPTFRGMRQSLMRTFDEIYVLDLHGNALKRERAPDGGPDKNVFDIRQGVAIAFFIKRGGKGKTDARVRHAELWGDREAKYAWLETHDVADTEWLELQPKSPFYLFVPQDATLTTSYNAFVSVSTVFPVNSVGIVTARDSLTIHWSPEEIWQVVTTFVRMAPELAREGYQLGSDVRDWKVALAQKDLHDSGPDRANVAPLLYRPFDVRHTYYTGQSRGFIGQPQQRVMRQMLAGENVALMMPKRVEHVGTWQHAFVTQHISDHVAVSLKTIDYHFPLYLYPEADRRDLFSHLEPTARRPNLNGQVVAALAAAHGREPPPEEVFNYVYAVLYAPTYRGKYAEFLRLDFPRIPFTADHALFAALAGLGGRLVGLHLLRSPELDPPLARFEGAGDGRVARGKGVRYDAVAERIYINATQYFAPVPAAVWGYQVGGYQVCHKWLKDRAERPLSLAEVRAYCRIVTALGRTIEIQGEIDALYAGAESSALAQMT
ncbi:MAG: DNA methyltransferase [Chloroflexi bacterium]|nr:DNA methyltransferase [Chloroflexota bacterium]